MSDERETTPQCPACEGLGRLRTEDGTSYRERACEVCAGTGCVTREQLIAWRLRRPIVEA